MTTSRKTWLIYGDILNRHVVDSFVATLQESGETVFSIPSLQRSHHYLDDEDLQRRILSRLEEAVDDHEVDVLFNFRASELGPPSLDFLRGRGIKCLVWLPDDPLLYHICYRYVVDLYDVVLHCGHEDVIAFYQEKHPGINGFNFPFWSDEKHFYYSYDPEHASCDIGFVGNCHTDNRAGRYELLASLPFHVSLYGKLPYGFTDNTGIHRGYLDKLQPEVLGKFRIGLSVPQYFRDSGTTEYQFDELSRFESFFFPSRIIQHAGCGVPTISPRSRHSDKIIPSLLTYESRDELISKVRQLLGNPEMLLSTSQEARCDFERYLTATARIRMLQHLLETPEAHYSLFERCDMWKLFSGELIAATDDENVMQLSSPQLWYSDFLDHGIVLSGEHVRSGSLLNNTVAVETMVRQEKQQVMFWMKRSDPQEGDFAEYATALECLPGLTYWTFIEVRSPYCSQQYKGRLAYQILLNDQLLLEEDISDWDEANQITILWKAAKPLNLLLIRVVAKIGCESWNWGLAGRLIVKRIHSREVAPSVRNEVVASSPYSIVYREGADRFLQVQQNKSTVWPIQIRD